MEPLTCPNMKAVLDVTIMTGPPRRSFNSKRVFVLMRNPFVNRRQGHQNIESTAAPTCNRPSSMQAKRSWLDETLARASFLDDKDSWGDATAKGPANAKKVHIHIV